MQNNHPKIFKTNEEKALTIWEKIMFVNRQHNWNWYYSSLDAIGNDLAGELAEICSDIKIMSGRGTHKKDVPTLEQLAIEYFDLYVYLVIGLESLGFTQEKFIEIANKKLNILEQRMKDNPK